MESSAAARPTRNDEERPLVEPNSRVPSAEHRTDPSNPPTANSCETAQPATDQHEGATDTRNPLVDETHRGPVGGDSPAQSHNEASQSTVLLDDTENEKGPPTKTHAAKGPSKPSWWRRLLSNTWLFETTAVAFSLLCLVAIAVVLSMYNGKTRPHLQFGLTLNAIISILATGSKSALLCAVGGAIGQLKWNWFTTDRKLLALQRYGTFPTRTC